MIYRETRWISRSKYLKSGIFRERLTWNWAVNRHQSTLIYYYFMLQGWCVGDTLLFVHKHQCVVRFWKTGTIHSRRVLRGFISQTSTYLSWLGTQLTACDTLLKKPCITATHTNTNTPSQSESCKQGKKITYTYTWECAALFHIRVKTNAREARPYVILSAAQDIQDTILTQTRHKQRHGVPRPDTNTELPLQTQT